MNGLGIIGIILGAIFFYRWVIVTSGWKYKADKYDQSKKEDDDIYVKNLDEILAEEERTRTARNIVLAYKFSKELLNIIISLFARIRLQKSKLKLN